MAISTEFYTNFFIVSLVAVCVTGDLQAYAIRPVTTTAGLNSTGVVVGSGTGQSLQVSKICLCFLLVGKH